MRYFEDFTAGDAFELGAVSVDEASIIDFARKYDPQTFHIDCVCASESPFGGLIASGWHTVLIVTKMWVDHVLADTAGCGSPGVDEIRFLQPVRPGDMVHGRAHVLSTSESRSKTWRGTVETRVEAHVDERVVMYFRTHHFVKRSHADSGDAGAQRILSADDRSVARANVVRR